MADAITYTNRKNKEYHLHEVTTKKGKVRYVFSRSPMGKAVTEIPSGYEIVESVNGVVSLCKVGSSPIRADEVECARTALAKHDLHWYRVEARKRDLLVFAPVGNCAAVAEEFGLSPEASVRLRSSESYTPVLRFTLIDERTRRFSASRMCYRSSVDGWLSLHDFCKLSDLLERYLPHLGRESFFELY